jgi:hypothetical protein
MADRDQGWKGQERPRCTSIRSFATSMRESADSQNQPFPTMYPLASQVTGSPFISSKRFSLAFTLQAKRGVRNLLWPRWLSPNPTTWPHLVRPSLFTWHLNKGSSPFFIRGVKSKTASTIPQYLGGRDCPNRNRTITPSRSLYSTECSFLSSR